MYTWAVEVVFWLNISCRDGVLAGHGSIYNPMSSLYLVPIPNSTHLNNQCVVSTPSLQRMSSEYSQSLYIIWSVLCPVRTQPLFPNTVNTPLLLHFSNQNTTSTAHVQSVQHLSCQVQSKYNLFCSGHNISRSCSLRIPPFLTMSSQNTTLTAHVQVVHNLSCPCPIRIPYHAICMLWLNLNLFDHVWPRLVLKNQL